MTIITYGLFDTAIGRIIIGQSAKGLCWLGWMTDGYKGNGLTRMKARFPDAACVRDDTKTRALMDSALDAWETDDLSSITLDLYGSEFQKSVWNALLDIPKGEVRTYGDIARAVRKPNAARAVGSAVGENPVSLLVPCHRVVPSSGGPGNYGWGVDVKEMLLRREQALPQAA